MNLTRVLTVSLLFGAAALTGCASAEKALGVAKVTPDEFRVVTKAPLSMPPDYSLRPPAPGQPRPLELQPEGQARAALMGQRAAVQRSDGERLLASRAGADRADPEISYVVDDEFGNVSHKDKTFADWVMFWKPGQASAPATGLAVTGDNPTPVNATAEDARIKTLTGDKPVIIARQRNSKIKLPGL